MSGSVGAVGGGMGAQNFGQGRVGGIQGPGGGQGYRNPNPNPNPSAQGPGGWQGYQNPNPGAQGPGGGQGYNQGYGNQTQGYGNLNYGFTNDPNQHQHHQQARAPNQVSGAPATWNGALGKSVRGFMRKMSSGWE